ncbi:hypothetical protein [Limibacter armeniacum]
MRKAVKRKCTVYAKSKELPVRNVVVKTITGAPVSKYGNANPAGSGPL